MVSLTDIPSFIYDPDECELELHQAAYIGDYETLEKLLTQEEWQQRVNGRHRPFGATPLRLAATGGHVECAKLLLQKGAAVNQPDYKAQTPLFVAIKNHHLLCAQVLLQEGADADGSIKNLCSPLYIASQDGFVEGVKLLLDYGAQIENVDRLASDIPGHPVHIAIVYGHLPCYVELLQRGAKINLGRISPPLPEFVQARLSFSHAMVLHKRPLSFAKLFHLFGGNLWQRDMMGRLPSELPTECNSKTYLAEAMSRINYF